MPELPEVEVVRRGLASWVRGRTITGVEVVDPRSVRRHAAGPEDLKGNLEGAVVADVVRRGKFLWLPLLEGRSSSIVPSPAGTADDVVPSFALMAHLGMSGQLLMEDSALPDEKHLKVRFTLSPALDASGAAMPDELRFVDQRIFGGVFLTDLVPTPDGAPGGLSETALPLVAQEAAHIARDPLDPAFSFDEFYRRLRGRKTGIKRALLDQGLISGVGNIYADESLWAARMHFARPTDTMRRADALRLVEAARDVMTRALAAGGTSFDSLYVNVNGASGYFSRSLNAYGREGLPCPRCEELGLHTLIRRDSFMNRSSYSCPVCQPRPRNGRW
ncbi:MULTISPECIES: bifunctional DNA-formamidopyrimidine glycosylase/DNA-(apurinic or apyrimidinic site) lyase [unclassified Arthrobacter]|uniref:bifunctional DNA-formamidopyrimidine glycosylase/DNA-(apurinic or apyrimidinic site) lyase n=1 Tax=unclassified Arthrobacter TaxID=235627 RepID=UPI001E5377EE|nr:MULTISPECIES: bifunctional DNA-formamidopyrimidine glycosylase/DNA-(apurinic or apyrimidinic site) lyase [unclassified Arthrobacter]MCC9145746.1 bifunctional DNA-formamidopyrimidine glycosylase/DNA-(apurinic or apyrimidinic site) lyase [Arthrobacter sp. zg-Y919]MDK1276975.1 bifunctional DNA-formamidopyrimidine glycosylase/DNA-(apurinic or apyrimidinic site) lyase [Arthrobacter sp. zg.Y919]WIB04095.1 bifunctional DNA-formamidopyrimidine glycosylase/DNA-(apurinic or apyrimidinic site) lyase [Ar